MRYLIINADYPEFLHQLYFQNPGLEKKNYEEQMQMRKDSLCGVADFYSSNLQKLGHEAWDIYVNNEYMQKAWAIEKGIPIKNVTFITQKWRKLLHQTRRKIARTPFRHLKPLFQNVLHSLNQDRRWFYDILAAQIRYYQPDVLLNQTMPVISCQFLQNMKPYARLLVGQHAAKQLSYKENWSVYDLIISSLPTIIEWFQAKGITAELHRLGFEPRILEAIQLEKKTYEITFIGSLFQTHQSRLALLEQLCKSFKQLKIWSPSIQYIPKNSLIREHYVGPAWGYSMYQILHNSKIILNHHIDITPDANNMRLYEATGIGSLLITDWKKNLHEMFNPDKEVIAYHNPEECVELIQYYLEHNDEREAIATEGQKRTLQEHTYYQRMKELENIIQKYI